MKEIRKFKVKGWVVGFSLGVICFGLGVYYEQFADIFQKAVIICLECIGIG